MKTLQTKPFRIFFLATIALGLVWFSQSGGAASAATTSTAVVWTNPINVSIKGNTITKTGGTAYQFTAGASSQQRLASGDGSLSVTVDNAADEVYSFVGLATSTSGAGYENINYAIYLCGWTVRVQELGQDKGAFGAIKPGDILSVAVESGKVNYYRNGVRFYSSAAKVAYPLYVDSSLADPGVRVVNAMLGGANWTGKSSVTPVVTAKPVNVLPTATVVAAVAAVTPPPAITCQMFPSDNIWNRNIASAPVSANSANYIAAIGASTPLHPDFASRLWQGETVGGFYSLVNASQALVPIRYTAYGSQSEAGPFPIPANAQVQGGANSTGDRHVLVVDTQSCKLYELFKSYKQSDNSWQAKSGAVWDLKSNALRPNGWTSSDAAGFAMLPGLVRYDELQSGAIKHAIRFTTEMANLSTSWVWPARHSDGESTDPKAPPMGTRLRLKANFDISKFDPQLQVVLTALKQYGMILADSGGPLNISGTVDPRWDDDAFHLLEAVKASDFEAVDESGLMIDINSGQSR